MGALAGLLLAASAPRPVALAAATYPQLLWSYSVAGSPQNVAVDAAGNVLVAGYTTFAGWTHGGDDTTLDGPSDAFVVKLDPEGHVVWSTYVGGAEREEAFCDLTFLQCQEPCDCPGLGLAVDAEGNIIVAGSTCSSNWAQGGYDTVHGGTNDAFVVKLSPSGARLWSTYLGGTDRDAAQDVAVGPDGGIWVTGTTRSPGWVSGGERTTHGGGVEYFLAKLSPDGGHLLSGYQKAGLWIALDRAGVPRLGLHSMVEGADDTVFSITMSSYVADPMTHLTGWNLWVDRATAPSWQQKLGAGLYAFDSDIALDRHGNVLATWFVDGSAGLSKYTADGVPAWSLTIPGAGPVAADSADNVVVVVGTTVVKYHDGILPAGRLQVDLEPAAAVSEGAQWGWTGSAQWHRSGEADATVPPGNARVDFQPLPGWVAPASMEVPVVKDRLTRFRAAYTRGSHLDLETHSIAVRGRYAYLACGGQGVAVLDLADPLQPRAVGSCPVTGLARGLALASDDLLCVASGTNGLHLLDVGTPNAPRLLGTYRGERSVVSVAAQESRAYVADMGDGPDGGEIVVVDIGDPGQPRRLGTWATPHQTHGMRVANRCLFAAQSRFVQDWDHGIYYLHSALTVLDLAEPAHPAVVNEFQCPAESLGAATDVAASGVFRYVSLQQGCLDYSVYCGAWPTGWCWYEARWPFNGLLALEASDPARPSVVGRLACSGLAGAVRVSGLFGALLSRPYTDACTNDVWTPGEGLVLFDLADPRRPRGLSSYPISSAVEDVALVGSTALVACGTDGLRAVDLSEHIRLLRFEGISLESSGELVLRLSGPTSTAAHLQRSTDLVNWVDWRTLTCTEDSLEIRDAEVPRPEAQFFRLIAP